MIRVLVMIAVTGFLVSVVTLSTAVAIGGPEILTHTAWNGWDRGHLHWDGDWNDSGRRRGGPEGTREMAWTGEDAVGIDVPADVTYTQGPGPAKLTITGPQRALDNLTIEDGHLRYRHDRRHWGEITVVMTAPNIIRFAVSGDSRLSIRDYKQDRMIVDLSGNGSVNAKGETRSAEISISGSGESDFTDLKVGDAKVDIDGSGNATLAPTGATTVNIAGSGDVTLLTRPSRLETNVSGSGTVNQRDGGPVAAPAAPAPPEPPQPPKAKRGRT